MRLPLVAWSVALTLLSGASGLAQDAADAEPQWTHRSPVTRVAFDATDGDRRAAMVDITGHCAVVDMATGTVLAARRLQRGYEMSASRLELVGDEVRVMFRDGDWHMHRWEWTTDVVESHSIDAYRTSPGAPLLSVAVNPADFDARMWLTETTLTISRGDRVQRVPIAGARALFWVNDGTFVVKFENHVEVRDAARPRRVLHRYDGRSMALGWDDLAVAHYTQVTVLNLVSGQERVLPHGRDQISVDVVVGEDAAGVVFTDGSALVPFDGGAPTTIEGAVQWVGPRTALTVRDNTVFRVRRGNGRMRRAAEAESSMYEEGSPVWTGGHGGFAVYHPNSTDVTLHRPNGRRFTPAIGGPHSVWHSDVLADGRLVLTGRFGAQFWSPAGVVDLTDCAGERLLGAFGDGILTETGRCTPAGAQRWPGGAEAVARGGDVVVLDSARVLDLATDRQTPLRGLSAMACDDEMGSCDWDAKMAPGLVGISREWSQGREGADTLVFSTSGERLASAGDGTRIALSADGSRFAFHHFRGGAVFGADGEERFRFGQRRGAPAASDAVFRADGRTLAWMADAETVEMLGPQGQSIWRAPVPRGSRVHEVVGRRIRITSSEGAFLVSSRGRTALPADISALTAACVDGRFASLDARGEVRLGPACISGRAEVHGDAYVVRAGGLSTFYRGDRAITVGSVRRGGGAAHFAYAADGAWWASAEDTLGWHRGTQVVEAPVAMGTLVRVFGP